jgi:hypothetical protein
VCPNGAIINELTATSEVVIIPQADIKPDLQADQKAIVLEETKESKHGIKTLAEAALAFIGSEVAPRVVDVVIKSIEQRLIQPKTTTIPPSPSSSRNYELQNKGQRKHMRYRGRNKAKRISNGRRWIICQDWTAQAHKERDLWLDVVWASVEGTSPQGGTIQFTKLEVFNELVTQAGVADGWIASLHQGFQDGHHPPHSRKLLT